MGRSPPFLHSRAVIAACLLWASGCAALVGLDETYSVGHEGGASPSGTGTGSGSPTATSTAVGGGTGTGTATSTAVGGGTGTGTATSTAVGGGSATGTASGGGTGTATGAGAEGGAGGGTIVDACGDGTVQSGEECDDGGKLPADGCSPTCEVECAGPKTAKHPATYHCYRYVNDGLVTWNVGRGICQAMGAGWDLGIVTSAAERDFVDDVLALPEGTVFANHDPFQYWLGGRDLSQTDVFEWINGEPWSYAPWDTNPQDPSHGNQNCIRLRALQGSSNDVFRDADCSLTSSVLCELQPAGTSP
ncbi:MAG: hypothetical protein JRI55_09185 [Deltaproteobacteria bacterium]|nr:hypothetical protein [Deltaproteobacteria bacterium]